MKDINENINDIFLPMTISEDEQMIITIDKKIKGEIKKAIDTTTDIKLKNQLEQLYYAEKILIENNNYGELIDILDSIDTECWTCNNIYNLKEDTKVIKIRRSKKLLQASKNNLGIHDLVKTGMCKFTEKVKKILNQLGLKYKVEILISLKNKLKRLYQEARFKFQILINRAKKIVSYSGGKDSTAMLIKLIESGEKIDQIAFADTGMEFPEMLEYIKKVQDYIGRKIDIVKSKTTWDKWFYGEWTKGKNKGQIRGFPKVIGLGCWAKRELKIKPLTKIEGKGNIIFLGIAADEKHRMYRSKYHTNNNIYRFPLSEMNMTENDCLNFLKEIGLENPLYKIFKRLGCWCCPKQPLNSLRKLYMYYPEKWEQLKKYEADSPTGFRPDMTLNELEKRFEKEIGYTQVDLFNMCRECVNI